MKLPNPVVLALGLVFVIIGPFVLPFEQYLWGFSHAFVMYFVGMFAFAYLGIGAGDGKFAAAMSMFVPLVDATLILSLFAAFLLGAFFGPPDASSHPRCPPHHARLGVVGP